VIVSFRPDSTPWQTFCLSKNKNERVANHTLGDLLVDYPDLPVIQHQV
jgi:hypothetical protein